MSSSQGGSRPGQSSVREVDPGCVTSPRRPVRWSREAVTINVMDPGATVALIGAGSAIVVSVTSATYAAWVSKALRRHDADMEALRAEVSRATRRELAQEDAQKIVEEHRRPLLASAVELKRRLGNVLHNGFLAYVSVDSRRSQIALLSTAYRVAAFLGWREFLGRKLTYLDYGDSERTTRLITLLEDVSTQFATDRSDFEPPGCLMLWKDEQRAVGGLMLEADVSGILGFEHFVANYDTVYEQWLGPFVADLRRNGVDSPTGRLAAIERSLEALIDHLDDEHVYRGRV